MTDEHSLTDIELIAKQIASGVGGISDGVLLALAELLNCEVHRRLIKRGDP